LLQLQRDWPYREGLSQRRYQDLLQVWRNWSHLSRVPLKDVTTTESSGSSDEQVKIHSTQRSRIIGVKCVYCMIIISTKLFKLIPTTRPSSSLTVRNMFLASIKFSIPDSWLSESIQNCEYLIYVIFVNFNAVNHWPSKLCGIFSFLCLEYTGTYFGNFC